jgi:hypothetical protein
MTAITKSSSVYFCAFAALSLGGSLLLFLVQPLVAKMALPQLGGSPAVWNSALVAYQVMLLAGYAYAHGLQRLTFRYQLFVHMALLVLSTLWLPIAFSVAQVPTGNSLMLWVPWQIGVAVGPMFVLSAAQAPLLQSWLRQNGSNETPYGLYVWSNLGSFVGLLAYPLLFDPITPLTLQSKLWSWGFAGFVAGMAALALALLRYESAPSDKLLPSINGSTQWPNWQQGLKWLLHAAIPSALVLATTTHLTTDIVALPLLWVLPLGLYLLSFVIAFSQKSRMAGPLAQRTQLPLALLGIVALSTDAFEVEVTGLASVAFLFLASIIIHRKLFNERPAQSGLPAFYLILSAGGAMGGFLVAIVAPNVFDWTYEFPLLVIAAVAMTNSQATTSKSLLAVLLVIAAFALVASVTFDWNRPPQIWLAVAFAMLVLLAGKRRFLVLIVSICAALSLSVSDALFLSRYGLHQRSFFGIYTISDNEEGTLRTLTHGTTTHGVQQLANERTIEPTGYFGPNSGVGRVLSQAPELIGPRAHIGIIGMGAGTLACYGLDGQIWTFYEIDPLVVDIAVRQGWFTYLTNCAPDAQIKLGDARLTLPKEPDQSLDILVMDAFSSDAVPTHLLTSEAFDIYEHVLTDHGVLLVHISNRYLDLEPVLARETETRGWSAALLKYEPSADERERGERASIWVVMSKSPPLLGQAIRGSEWRKINIIDGFRSWTDDYGSVLSLIKWRGWGE